MTGRVDVLARGEPAIDQHLARRLLDTLPTGPLTGRLLTLARPARVLLDLLTQGLDLPAGSFGQPLQLRQPPRRTGSA